MNKEDYLVYTLRPKKIKYWNVQGGTYDKPRGSLIQTDLFEIIMSGVDVEINKEQSEKIEGFPIDFMDIEVKIYMRDKSLQPKEEPVMVDMSHDIAKSLIVRMFYKKHELLKEIANHYNKEDKLPLKNLLEKLEVQMYEDLEEVQHIFKHYIKK